VRAGAWEEGSRVCRWVLPARVVECIFFFREYADDAGPLFARLVDVEFEPELLKWGGVMVVVVMGGNVMWNVKDAVVDRLLDTKLDVELTIGLGLDVYAGQ
jgi:hypothetical protein